MSRKPLASTESNLRMDTSSESFGELQPRGCSGMLPLMNLPPDMEHDFKKLALQIPWVPCWGKEGTGY